MAMTNTPAEAVAAAATQSHQGPKSATGMCLKMVRTCYAVPAKSPDAASAWHEADYQHPESNPLAIPAGVPVFWTGGSEGHGHIAISIGDGECWSTDIKRNGYFDRCRIADIERQWGMKLAGWAEDINGVRVYISPPKPLPPTRVTKARALLVEAASLGGPIRKAKINAALKLLPKR